MTFYRECLFKLPYTYNIGMLTLTWSLEDDRNGGVGEPVKGGVNEGDGAHRWVGRGQAA